VGEQVPDGNVLFAGSRKTRQVVPHRLVEVESSLIDQDHRHAGGGDHLGQAGEVVEGVGGDRRRVFGIGESAVGPQVREGASVPDCDDGSRERPPLEEAGEDAVDLLGAASAQRRLAGSGRGQRHRPSLELYAVTVWV
jgi:hypothetical protein